VPGSPTIREATYFTPLILQYGVLVVLRIEVYVQYRYEHHIPVSLYILHMHASGFISLKRRGSEISMIKRKHIGIPQDPHNSSFVSLNLL
jgi:hypothetical protein